MKNKTRMLRVLKNLAKQSLTTAQKAEFRSTGLLNKQIDIFIDGKPAKVNIFLELKTQNCLKKPID